MNSIRVNSTTTRDAQSFNQSEGRIGRGDQSQALRVRDLFASWHQPAFQMIIHNSRIDIFTSLARAATWLSKVIYAKMKLICTIVTALLQFYNLIKMDFNRCRMCQWPESFRIISNQGCSRFKNKKVVNFGGQILAKIGWCHLHLVGVYVSVTLIFIIG